MGKPANLSFKCKRTAATAFFQKKNQLKSTLDTGTIDKGIVSGFLVCKLVPKFLFEGKYC